MDLSLEAPLEASGFFLFLFTMNTDGGLWWLLGGSVVVAKGLRWLPGQM